MRGPPKLLTRHPRVPSCRPEHYLDRMGDRRAALPRTGSAREFSPGDSPDDNPRCASIGIRLERTWVRIASARHREFGDCPNGAWPGTACTEGRTSIMSILRRETAFVRPDGRVSPVCRMSSGAKTICQLRGYRPSHSVDWWAHGRHAWRRPVASPCLRSVAQTEHRSCAS
jgi:hypothetical protein